MNFRKESDYVKYKTDYLNEYFENLNLSSNEPDWNIMILQAMQFKEFQDCKALLEMMNDGDYVRKYKFILESKFDEMVDWFLTKKLEVMTRPIPAYASDNRKLHTRRKFDFKQAKVAMDDANRSVLMHSYKHNNV
ncbi:hypothetical protein Hanom_Chr15g01382531 [Helianthus anomalus]